METRGRDQHAHHCGTACSVTGSIGGSVPGATDDTGCVNHSRNQTNAGHETNAGHKAVAAGQSHSGNQPDTMIVWAALRGRPSARGHILER